EENWNKTHRLAGKLWVGAGAIMMLTAFFENVFIMLSIVFIAVIIPTVYSYTLFAKENKNK
ncbi:MAG: SdpI family protein, partial [Clostridia bacterium]|nr:SdpI family protein [Clostridia bacterium]